MTEREMTEAEIILLNQQELQRQRQLRRRVLAAKRRPRRRSQIVDPNGLVKIQRV